MRNREKQGILSAKQQEFCGFRIGGKETEHYGVKNKRRRTGFRPLPLDDGTVQAVFERCVADVSIFDDHSYSSVLFSRRYGYKPEDEEMIMFDKKKTDENQKNILYLYGQLKSVHKKSRWLEMNEAFLTYSGDKWTTRKGVLLEFLYLGAINNGTSIISIFNAENHSALLNNYIKPTLSPRDPDFPAWWEQHKSEWEDPQTDV